ncbi:helix-turn-helix domain-containing protein [Mycobacteroides abscessus]|uniref:hypothetical protein n=1 Tax=Mycobacteroides abscessus TaxID=36809 RepID=UPI0009C6891D|nr:hypothetical protein [Mycobacteroides abscessus]SKQ85101.1 Uncharacterised protein [Mycobacteroides abscessus subsp. massiliense]
MTANPRHSLNERHKQILAVLSNAAEPMSTSAIRRRANKNRTTQLVAEQVYRTLRTLHSRGHIQRLTKGGETETYWQHDQAVANDTAQPDPAALGSHPDITEQGARK